MGVFDGQRKLGAVTPINTLNEKHPHPRKATHMRHDDPEPSRPRPSKRRRRETSPSTTTNASSPAPRSADGTHARDEEGKDNLWHWPSSPPTAATTAAAATARRRRSLSNQSSTNISTHDRILIPELRGVNKNLSDHAHRHRKKHGWRVAREVAYETIADDNEADDDDDDVVHLAKPPRKKLRERMRLPVLEAAPTGGPAEPKTNSRKRALHGHENDSADELSKEYFPEPPAKRLSRGGRTGSSPGAKTPKTPERSAAGDTKTTRTTTTTSPFLQNMIDRPLCVKAAFLFPCLVFSAEEKRPGKDAPPPPVCTLTVAASAPNVLAVQGRAEANLPTWLEINLEKVNSIRTNTNSPIAMFDVPQHAHPQLGHLGPRLGLQFYSSEDTRRLMSWVYDSRCFKRIKMDEPPVLSLQRSFDKGFEEAAAASQKKVPRAPDPNDTAPPARITSDLVSAAQRPKKDGAPAERSFMSRIARSILPSRTRSQRASGGTTPETVDLETADLAATADPRPTPPTRSSTRLSARSTRARGEEAAGAPPAEVERWTEAHPDWAQAWRIPLTYSRTTVDKDDVARLDEGQFLNDNVINFYLQFLQDTLQKSASSIARRVYFHNTFFYEKLRPRSGHQIAFEGVKRWTAKVDLFSYDYIVVPVNENAHWWVAIVCNVPKILAAAMPGGEARKGDEEVVDAEKGAPKTAVAAVDGPARTSEPVESTNKTDVDKTTDVVKTVDVKTVDVVKNGDDSSDDNDDNDDDEVKEIRSDSVVPPPATKRTPPAKRTPRGRDRDLFIPGAGKQDPKDARIFTLDSLGSVHRVSVGHLKQWLMAEVAERKGVKPANPGRLGTTAKAIPQQENFCDCGVYLLLYIQEFTKDPDAFIEDIVLHRAHVWSTTAPDMRKQLRDLILHKQKEFQAAEEAKKESKKRRKAQSGGSGEKSQELAVPPSTLPGDDKVSLVPPLESASPKASAQP